METSPYHSLSQPNLSPVARAGREGDAPDIKQVRQLTVFFPIPGNFPTEAGLLILYSSGISNCI